MNEFNDTPKEITSNWIFELLPKLLKTENEERKKAEKILDQYIYEPSLYQNLIEIGLYNKTISENEKLQIFILLRKLIKDNLLFNKLASTSAELSWDTTANPINTNVENLRLSSGNSSDITLFTVEMNNWSINKKSLVAGSWSKSTYS